LDQRFIEKLLRTKVSDQCIFSLARIPDSARLVVDANKRATILSEATFEVTAELDPNDSQMVAVGFQKDKMIAHFASKNQTNQHFEYQILKALAYLISMFLICSPSFFSNSAFVLQG
jgi:hypothetical protein